MKVVLEPTYEVIKPFNGNYAKAKNLGRWGIIDKKGKVVVDIIYDDLGELHKNTAWAKMGTSYGLVSNNKYTALDGAEKIWDFGEGDLAYAKKYGKIGFVDLKGNWVIEPKFDKARGFEYQLAPVCVGKKWGYVNAKGEMVIDFIFLDA